MRIQSDSPANRGDIRLIEIMRLNPTLISIGLTTAEAAALMYRDDVDSCIITENGNKKLIGIMTITDVFNMMGGGSRYNLVINRPRGRSLLCSMTRSGQSPPKKWTVCPSQSRYRRQSVFWSKAGTIVSRSPIQTTPSQVSLPSMIMKMFAGAESDLTVEEIMTKDPKVVAPDVPISCVTRQMVENDYRRLPVISDDPLIGMITATDIRGYLGGCRVFSEMKTGSADEVLNLQIRDLMTGANIRTMSPDEKINEVAREMLEFGIGVFPVIDDGKLTGIVTEFDLVKGLAGNM